MINLELGEKKLPLSPRMKLFSNDYHSKTDFIPVYNTFSDAESNPSVLTRPGRLKATVLATFFEKSAHNPDRNYFALNEITSLSLERNYCSKSKCSLILSEFLQFGLFLESRIYATDLNRKLNLISFPETLLDLKNAMKAYIEFLNLKVSNKSAVNDIPVKTKAAAIENQISAYPSSTISKEKNVIIMKDDRDTSLLTILSSICPVDKTLVQEGVLMFNHSNSQKLIENKNKPNLNYRTTTWSDSNSVMMFRDLKTYVALITLVYHAHLAKFNDYYHKQYTPRNISHVHLDDILRIISRGKKQSFGGTQRTECRESLQRIRKTNIELRPESAANLSGIASNSSLATDELFKTERTLSPLKELSRVEFMDGNGKWGQSTMDYIVQLPDDLFEKMFTSKFHWLFPPSFLTIHEVLFALYFFLRNNWTKGTNKKTFEVGDFYYQHEATTNNLSEFIARFNTLLIKLSKTGGQAGIKKTLFSATKVPYKKQFKIKLFGYFCYINLDTKTMEVELKEDLFYAALEMNSTNRKSPTWSNKLANLTYSELLNKKNFSEEDTSIIQEMTLTSKSMLPNTNQSLKKRLPRMLPCADKELGYIELTLGNNKKQSYFITLLSSNEYIENICKEISLNLGVSFSDVSDYIFSLASSIPKIYLSKTIEINDFRTVYDQYIRSTGSEDSIKNQMEFFAIAQHSPSSFHFMMSYVREQPINAL